MLNHTTGTTIKGGQFTEVRGDYSSIDASDKRSRTHVVHNHAMHERCAHHVGDVYQGSVGSVQKGLHLHNAPVSTTNDFGGGFPTSPSTFGSVDHNLSPGLALPRRVERARSPSRRDTEPPQYPRLPAGAHLETHTQQPTFNDGRQQERPAFFVVDSATGDTRGKNRNPLGSNCVRSVE